MSYVIIFVIIITPVLSRAATGGLHPSRNNRIYYSTSLGVKNKIISGSSLKSYIHSQY